MLRLSSLRGWRLQSGSRRPLASGRVWQRRAYRPIYLLSLAVATALALLNVALRSWEQTWPDVTLALSGLAAGVGLTGLVVEGTQRRIRERWWAPARQAVLASFVLATDAVADSMKISRPEDLTDALASSRDEALGPSLERLERRLHRCVAVADNEFSAALWTDFRANDVGDSDGLMEFLREAFRALVQHAPSSRGQRLPTLKRLPERVLPSLAMLDDSRVSALATTLDSQITTLELAAQSVTLALHDYDDSSDANDPFSALYGVITDSLKEFQRDKSKMHDILIRLRKTGDLSLGLQLESYALGQAAGTLLKLTTRLRKLSPPDDLQATPWARKVAD